MNKIFLWFFGPLFQIHPEAKPETKLQVLQRHGIESKKLSKQCVAEMDELVVNYASQYAKEPLGWRHLALYEEMDVVQERELQGFGVVTVNVDFNAKPAEPASGGLASTVRHLIGE